ncbi:hypothetical protein [Polaribacter sp.]|uniref:hypothetical protein n=1 Tax=Polaribacter sp. TaxID=1920175 RepID=UPI003F6AD414
MDTTTQIKKDLIHRIKTSTDLSFLKALQTIFDSTEQSLYQLSTKQSEAIEIGRQEIKAGNFEENKEVISDMKKWLTSK